MMENTLPAGRAIACTDVKNWVANIVGVMITSRENWASVNYAEQILNLKKRDVEDAEYVGVPA